VSRILAIGDIHGCSRALNLLLAAIDPHGEDTVITLGDAIDRGPDSRGVLDRLIDLHRSGRLVPLRGNHEMMLLAARRSQQDEEFWRHFGGVQALQSYSRLGRPGTLEDIPAKHWNFLEFLSVDWHECSTHFFVHANAYPDYSLDAQPRTELFWQTFLDRGPHCSGKIMVCGHTQQSSGVPLNIGHAICLDTLAYGDGWLTGLDVTTGQVWQANQRGEHRTAHIDDFLVNRGATS
jgi:serine/threonine protein phosphatase 1